MNLHVVARIFEVLLPQLGVEVPNIGDYVLNREREIGVHEAFHFVHKIEAVPSFKEVMSAQGLVDAEVQNTLHGVLQNSLVVTDALIEEVPLPHTMWGVSFLSMNDVQKSVTKYLFHKRLADVVSGWRDIDHSANPWTVAFGMYK